MYGGDDQAKGKRSEASGNKSLLRTEGTRRTEGGPAPTAVWEEIPLQIRCTGCGAAVLPG